MSRAAPGRVTVASQTPHLPLLKPLQFFFIQANPNSDSPAPFFLRGYLPLTPLGSLN